MAEGVLGAIVERKRRDVASRLVGATSNARPTRRSLRAALARPGARFVMEVKKASPSGHRSFVSVEAAVDAYAPVADAISVLTDGPFFGGSLEDLRTARAWFNGPILAKDFIVDPRQVAEARAYGADAVLAILAALSDGEAAAILGEANKLSMDVVVEVRDEAELVRALGLGARIIGINNRDLRTLQVNLSTTERLAPLVPRDRLIISESGIGTRSDVERLGPLVDAFLVGSSLMAADDVAQAARRLLFGPVKICGLTQARDVQLAADAGATHAGFIFAADSPRRITADAAALVNQASSAGLRTVGVFRDQQAGEVVAAAHTLGLDAVQLHGGDPDLRSLRAVLPAKCEIWGVCAVGDSVDPVRPGSDRTLFDTRSGKSSGGSGRAFDWARIAARSDLSAAFLAGGIGSKNAGAASAVGAFGLDIGSRVEVAPGIKDPERVQSLFASLRVGSRGDIRCA